MLRYLSSYLFQNENQPNENDPTQVTSSEGGEGPTSSTNDKPKDPNREREEENDTKGDGEEMDLEMREVGEEEDDWVLIGEGKPEKKEEKVGGAVVQCQPNVGLVAAPSTEEEDSDEDSEEESEEEEENSEETGLLWENKLIEHPSMSVYVDLATSIDSSIGVQTSWYVKSLKQHISKVFKISAYYSMHLFIFKFTAFRLAVLPLHQAQATR